MGQVYVTAQLPRQHKNRHSALVRISVSVSVTISVPVTIAVPVFVPASASKSVLMLNKFDHIIHLKVKRIKSETQWRVAQEVQVQDSVTTVRATLYIS